jgi:hypothetical protein
VRHEASSMLMTHSYGVTYDPHYCLAFSARCIGTDKRFYVRSEKCNNYALSIRRHRAFVGTYCTGGWVGLVGVKGSGKSRLRRGSNSRSESLYRLSYRGRQKKVI